MAGVCSPGLAPPDSVHPCCISAFQAALLERRRVLTPEFRSAVLQVAGHMAGAGGTTSSSIRAGKLFLRYVGASYQPPLYQQLPSLYIDYNKCTLHYLNSI